MKKIFTFLFAVMAGLSTASAATTVKIDGIYYKLDETNLTAEVGSNSHSSISGELVIPSSVVYNDVSYAVTGIGSNAFYFCTSITSVTIPSSITSIGSFAFDDCASLESAIINSSLIGTWMFDDCPKLSSVTIGSNVASIEPWAFDGCTSIFSMTVPNTVTSIGSHAFNGVKNVNYSGTATGSPWGAKCVNGTIDGYFLYKDDTKATLVACNKEATGSVSLPNTITSIMEGAFSGCTGLPEIGGIRYADWYLVEAVDKTKTSYTIQSNTKWIAESAFSGCTKVPSITIPNTVTKIGNYAFRNVTNVIYSGTATGSPWGARCVNGYVDGYLVYTDATKTTLAACSPEATGTITVPNSVTTIKANAFYDCKEITDITLPNTITSIGTGVFYGCTGLPVIGGIRYAGWYLVEAVDNTKTTYTIKSGTKWIAESAFRHGYLTAITIPNSVKNIGAYAFEDCYYLTSISIPSSVISIGSNAFSRCINLENATIYGSMISTNMFEACTKLSSVTIGSNVTTIGSRAFLACSNIFSMTVPKAVTKIGEEAFNGITNVNYSGTATGSPWGAKCVNGYLDGYVLYKNANRDTVVACHPSAIGKIVLPNSVTTIKANAFYNCDGITDITIPNSVTSIGSSAFSSCGGLTSVSIPSSVTSIGSNAFGNCSNLTVINVDANNANYCSVEGVLCSKDTTSLLQYPIGNKATSYVLPNRVKIVGDYAFNHADNLTSVTIGENVTSIGNSAFNTDSLRLVACRAITPPALYDFIPSTVFNDFSIGFTRKLFVPVGTVAAYQNSKWRSYFGSNIFEGFCVVTFLDADSSIIESQPVIYGTAAVSPQMPEIFGYTFIGWDKDITNVTSDMTVTALYQRDAINGFYYIYDTENSTAVMDREGDSYAKMKTLNVPNHFIYRGIDFSVVAIGANAFEGCDRLTDVVLPSNVEYVHEYAFSGCSDMVRLTLSAGLRGIEDYAFKGCKRLEEITVYAERVPDLTATSFYAVGNKKYIDVYVPDNRVNSYKRDEYWSEFNIVEKTATTVAGNVDDVKVESEETAAQFTWPTTTNAASYTIQITKDGEVVCTLIFNANGQLTGIAFAPGKGNRNAPAATTGNGGMQFTVTGLDAGTHYAYTVTTKDAQEQVIATYEGAFDTFGSLEGFDLIQSDITPHKVLCNGQVLILCGDKAYTLQGQEVK